MGIDKRVKQAFDFSIFGGLTKNGGVKKLRGENAVYNALRTWLLSKEGDYIRRPSEGGFLYNWLCKPMSEYNTSRMLNSIQIGIEYNFKPQIVIESLEVIPDYKNRLWTINLEGFVPEYNISISFTQDFRSLI